jgi:hypothetical protein
MLMTCDDEPWGLVMTGHCTRYQGPARRAQMRIICISALVACLQECWTISIQSARLVMTMQSKQGCRQKEFL